MTLLDTLIVALIVLVCTLSVCLVILTCLACQVVKLVRLQVDPLGFLTTHTDADLLPIDPLRDHP